MDIEKTKTDGSRHRIIDWCTCKTCKKCFKICCCGLEFKSHPGKHHDFWKGAKKSAFAVIIGSRYQSYEEACGTLNMETVSKRREKLSLKFATKSFEHEIHSKGYVPYEVESITRSEKPFLNPVQGRTERLLKSAIPYLITLLNKKLSSVPL